MPPAVHCDENALHVVRIFPNAEICLRLIRTLAAETHENRLESARHLKLAHLAKLKKVALCKIEEWPAPTNETRV